MNIGKSFSFAFEDKQWVGKFGLGALITFIPILNFAWTGYLVGIIRNVMNGASEPLPTWDDLGKKFMDGLLLTAASLVYALPIIVVFCVPLSLMIVPAFLSENRDLQGLADAVAGIGSVLFVFLICIFLIYALALSVIYPAILVLFAREGTFTACFKFREAFELIGRNAGPFFTGWGVSIGGGLVVGLVAGIVQAILSFIPCIGQIISLVLTIGIVIYTSAVYAHLFGQFGNVAAGQRRAMAAS